jgi:hypothetical protein
MGQSMWFFKPKKENYEGTYEQISERNNIQPNYGSERLMFCCS